MVPGLSLDVFSIRGFFNCGRDAAGCRGADRSYGLAASTRAQACLNEDVGPPVSCSRSTAPASVTLPHVRMCAGSNAAPSGREVSLAQLLVILATASSVFQVALAMNLKLVMASALPSQPGTIADAVASVTTAISNPCSNNSLK